MELKWALIENELCNKLEHWNLWVSSSPIDRVFIAKTMLASLLWYHVSVMPWPDHLLQHIGKNLDWFTWKLGVYKVSKAQCLLPKSELGLGAWDLISKAEGLRTKWCLKLIQGKINHYLEDALERMEEMYLTDSEMCNGQSGTHLELAVRPLLPPHAGNRFYLLWQPTSQLGQGDKKSPSRKKGELRCGAR